MALMCAKSDIKRDTEMKSMRPVAVGLNGAPINNQCSSARVDHMTRIAVNGRFPPVLGRPDTASARTIYGRSECQLWGLRYGAGTRTNRAVQPYCTVRRAALVLTSHATLAFHLHLRRSSLFLSLPSCVSSFFFLSVSSCTSQPSRPCIR